MAVKKKIIIIIINERGCFACQAYITFSINLLPRIFFFCTVSADIQARSIIREYDSTL